MATKTYKYGQWEEANRRLKSLDKLVKNNIATALRYSAKDLVRKIKLKIRRGDIGWEQLSPITVKRKGGSKPLKDTGSLGEAIVSKYVNKFTYEVGIPKGAKNSFGVSMVTIAYIQEYGKVIKPKKAKVMAIPLTNEAKQLQHQYKSARNIPGLFRLKGRKLLVRKKGATLEPMFVLLDKVTVPPRSIFNSTFNKEKKSIINRLNIAADYAMQGRRYTR